MRSGVDVVIHFAAESHVDKSIAQPAAFVQTNVVGTQTMLASAHKFGVQKFIQISTDEVYGSLAPNAPAFTEQSPLQPNSPYAATKASADLLVRAYRQTYGLNVNITRCTNNYGPFQYPEKLIPHMILKAIDGVDLPVYGDGLHVRDWLHVWDHCKAIDLIIQRGRPGEVYNIGPNNERTNLEIVKAILQVTDKSESLISHIEDRLGHDRRYAIDATKIRAELGWRPRYTFNAGISETIRWYLNNPTWLRQMTTSVGKDVK